MDMHLSVRSGCSFRSVYSGASAINQSIPEEYENERLVQNTLRVILKLIVLLFVFPVMITDLFFRSFVFFCVCNGKII